MKIPRTTAATRAILDFRFKEIGPIARYSPPASGWVKAIRLALGMSAAQLATRAGMRQPSVVNIEQSEAKGTIELATLRRMAEALDCTLVYALVPNRPLEETVRERARRYLRGRIDPIEHTMALEDQSAAIRNLEERVDEALRETNPRRFWDEP